ncbi:MAG TPA: hypothetical protein VLJ61_00985 [Pyrinomonadaceae bacterium]|nr:hypothetical protein [Pyrinomonadaceae bacterium]
MVSQTKRRADEGASSAVPRLRSLEVAGVASVVVSHRDNCATTALEAVRINLRQIYGSKK